MGSIFLDCPKQYDYIHYLSSFHSRAWFIKKYYKNTQPEFSTRRAPASECVLRTFTKAFLGLSRWKIHFDKWFLGSCLFGMRKKSTEIDFQTDLITVKPGHEFQTRIVNAVEQALNTKKSELEAAAASVSADLDKLKSSGVELENRLKELGAP